MKIALDTRRTVKWPVSVNVPQDGGTTRVQKFTAHFEIAAASALKARLDDPEADFAAWVIERLVGWDEDLRDEADQPIAFSEETRAALCDIPYVRAAVVEAYFAAAAGGRRKN